MSPFNFIFTPFNVENLANAKVNKHNDEVKAIHHSSGERVERGAGDTLMKFWTYGRIKA